MNTTTDPVHATADCAVVIGASRGIGLALTRQLLHGGVNQVHAASRAPNDSKALLELLDRYPARLHTHTMDVTDETSAARAASSVRERTGEVDFLIHCAGVLHGDWDGSSLSPERRLADVNAAALTHCFAVNSLGPLLTAKHFSPLFPRKSRVVLVNVSARVGSISDNRLGGWYAYRASKAAQNMFTRNLSIELKRSYQGLICVAFHPGTVTTELSAPFLSNVPPARQISPDRAAQRMLLLVEGLDETDNGQFIGWDGQVIPW